ncbi:alpha/beta hydrolase family protein [Streptomyces halstedii]|uniref:alpha/beta hydrolase family protein n=1 Tax=Streptomyces halstedii TaxID=1944 RepID=UPI0037F5F60D
MTGSPRPSGAPPATGQDGPGGAGVHETAAKDGAPARFHVYHGSLPQVCGGDPDRMAFTADADGRCQIFTWDASARRARQVTHRPQGTAHSAVDPAAHVWWFDEDARGAGRWLFQPFDGGPDRPGLTGVPRGTPRGLSVGDDATVVMGVGGPRSTTVYTGTRGGPAREVTCVNGLVTLRGTTPSAGLLALGGPAGSARAVTVLASDGRVAAVLSGERHRLWALGFAPVRRDGADELLLVQETDDGYLPACWTPDGGLRTHPWCAFDTEITARWYPDGRHVLIRQDRHGRSVLYRAGLADRTLAEVPTRPGSLLDAAPRRDDDVHVLWTDTAHPPRMYSTAGTALPPLATIPGQVPGDHRDLWTTGRGGPVHTLLSLPADRSGPVPAVFLVHGGPTDHDRDAYDGIVHSLVASGFAVARVNYRGSTGYGPRWRREPGGDVGLAQTDDLAAVRADLVGRGLIRADATGLWGVSWGGYLVLLALGRHPGLWQAGVAVKPVADCAAAHRTTTPALRALDERLFGGTPDTVPARYARNSPISYAGRVADPVLVVAAGHDAKCPPGQVRGYLDALRAAGARHEAMWLDSGHDGYEGEDHVAVLRRAVGFLDRELRGPLRAPKTPPSARKGGSRRSHDAAGEDTA